MPSLVLSEDADRFKQRLAQLFVALSLLAPATQRKGAASVHDQVSKLVPGLPSCDRYWTCIVHNATRYRCVYTRMHLHTYGLISSADSTILPKGMILPLQRLF